MIDPMDRLIVCAVAQLPFETGGGEGAVHTFCTLAPVLFLDGTPARAADFPNNGLIWWKLRAGGEAYAQPGRLVVGRLEHAMQYAPGDPNKQMYQVYPPSASPMDPEEALEVLRVRPREIATARDLVNVAGVAETDHPPAERVLVRWNGHVYGPFATSIAASGGGLHRVTLRTVDDAGDVVRVAESSLDVLGADDRLVAEATVSLNSTPATKPHAEPVRCTYELLMAGALGRLRREADSVRLLRDDDVIAAAARRILDSGERERLERLLERLQASPAGGRGEGFDVATVVDAVRRRLGRAGDGAVADLVNALLQGDLLEERVERAIQERVERYIDDNASAVQTRIGAHIEEVEAELARLTLARDGLADELAAARVREVAERDARAAEFLAGQQVQSAQERARIDAAQQALEEERARLGADLRGFAAGLGERRAELVAAVVAVLDVLGTGQRGEHARSSSIEGAGTTDTQSVRGNDVRAPLRPPAFLAQPLRDAPSEAAFFDRFRVVAHETGYQWSPLTLVACHLAFKSGQVVVLSGAAGVGAPALALSYARALAGVRDDMPARFAAVVDNPQWQSFGDALGRVDAGSRTFVPAAGELLAHLGWAAEEQQRHGGSGGVHVACLEMQFADRLDAMLAPLLERRDVMSVAPEALLGLDDPYRQWAWLSVSPAVRLAVTVPQRFDAPGLSQPVLAGAQVVRVAGGRGAATVDAPVHGSAEQPAVPVRAYSAWVREAALPSDLAGTLDRMRPHLERLGLPITTLLERAVRRWVAGALPVCPPPQAFDLFFAGRLALAELDVATAATTSALTALADVAATTDVSLPETVAALNARRMALEDDA